MGRLVGFAALAGLGLAILACVVLIPPYARLQWARYDKACNQAINADYQDKLAAEQFFIDSLETDEILIERQAASTLGGLFDPDSFGELQRSPDLPANLLSITPNPRPAPPSGWVIRTAERLKDVRIRRGLCVLSAVAILAAVLLFSNPAKYTDAQSPETA
ncbi:MAG: hypothetical protein ACLFUJ_09970 [Phycisphaerae bacterium]